MSFFLRRRWPLLLFFLLVSGCATTKQTVKPAKEALIPPPAMKIEIKPGIVSGKATYENEPLLGVLVYLYEDASGDFQGKAAYVSEETGADGSFRIKVNPGNYYVVARKGEGEKDEYHCFYGGNPLHVNPGQNWLIGLSLVKKSAPDPGLLPTGMPEGAGIRGIVYLEGKPLSGAQVMVYLNTNSNFKGMGFDQRFSDAKGRFVLDLPEGTYYLIARKRKSGQMAGPLVTGDYYAYEINNPLVVREGKYLDTVLTCVVKQDKLDPEIGKKGKTLISGIVMDKDNKPLSGVYVGAYLTSQVMGKPEYVSPLTDDDGKFVLELPEGGKYYLMGRNTYAGPPVIGDLVGWYQGSVDHSIEVKTGSELADVKITVNYLW